MKTFLANAKNFTNLSDANNRSRIGDETGQDICHALEHRLQIGHDAAMKIFGKIWEFFQYPDEHGSPETDHLNIRLCNGSG